ncbi:DUF2167 domain-containing protein [Curtobacterium flaccumfaciens]|uniref:DUF2167 domain-containing protein n=1 Tax=Curtobacterium flaccumfaciens TaxID=2035 RepID=UPI00215A4E58|nr:DUF2167 domain-containing protein [Curtobacterium flaccumfaciens]
MSAEQFVALADFQDGTSSAAGQGAFRPEPRFPLSDDDAAGAGNVLGQPPDDSMLGMIRRPPARAGRAGAWAVVVTYADDGYVSDEDASKIDYKDMLADMQKQTREENTPRKEAGYERGPGRLGGAARCDAATKKLYWARELAFQGNPGHTPTTTSALLAATAT